MFEKIKGKLLADLGKLGIYIFYALILSFIFVPLSVCGFPWWVDIILVAVIFLLPAIGGVCSIAIWVWSFSIIRAGDVPQTLKAVYYITLAIYLSILVLPYIISLISSSCKPVKKHKSEATPELETWYTCPQCGSLVHIGETCDCGFVPPLKIPKTAIFRARYDVFTPIIWILLIFVAVWGWLGRSEVQTRNEYLTEVLAETKDELDSANYDKKLAESQLEDANTVIADLRTMAAELRDEKRQYMFDAARVAEVKELLKHGRILNPYTEEPMLNIDDFIEYAKYFNYSISNDPLDRIKIP